jgi:Xaa-Pro aminopeptidase
MASQPRHTAFPQFRSFILVSNMRAQSPSSALFTKNRSKLAELLPKNAVAVIHSNDIYSSNADATLPFKQNSDLFYLTGIAQEETILLLFPDSKNEKNREILFIRESNETLAIWEGAKLTKQQALEKCGVQHVQFTHKFDDVFNQLALQADSIFLSTNEHPRCSAFTETKNSRFIADCQRKFPLHQYGRLSPLLQKLRMLKSEEEIALTRKACEITEAGFRRVLEFVKPGVSEWEVEAEFIHEFVKSGSRGFAYTPIIAGGGNACILHYVDNNQVLKDGEMLLLDVACEYAGWNADMTRTIPVNGKFTPRQRQVYDAVLRIMRFSNRILRPGILLPDYQKLVIGEIERELIALGLFTAEQAAAQDESKPLVANYFMHGVSHHLGLDVHDVSPPFQAVTPGMLFTIEPGIYIREENLGIRLENDFLICENENIDLMASIPIEADDIERLMKS